MNLFVLSLWMKHVHEVDNVWWRTQLPVVRDVWWRTQLPGVTRNRCNTVFANVIETSNVKCTAKTYQMDTTQRRKSCGVSVCRLPLCRQCSQNHIWYTYSSDLVLRHWRNIYYLDMYHDRRAAALRGVFFFCLHGTTTVSTMDPILFVYIFICLYTVCWNVKLYMVQSRRMH